MKALPVAPEITESIYIDSPTIENSALFKTTQENDIERDSDTVDTRPTVRDYFYLTKPGIVLLLLITTVGGMFIAAGGIPPLHTLLWTFLGGACAAGGANALNSYVDRDIDPQMSRTSRRPLARNRVPPIHALLFGLTLTVASVLILGFFVNWLSAGLSFIGTIYYAWFYTKVLKRSTPHNIVVGGGAGAIPPMVGWAAVTGGLDLFAFYLFAIIFYWTPPHTWALMLLIKKDYRRVSVPMFPVIFGDTETHRQILLYSILLIILTLLPVITQHLGWPYLIIAALLGGLLLYQSYILLREPSKARARTLYKFSNYYLALLFLAMAIDRIAGFSPVSF